MNTLRGFLLSLAVALPLSWAQASAAQGTAASAISRIEYRGGKLSLQARDAPMFEVVSRIAALAGFEVVPIGEVSDLPRVTVSFSGVPLAAALDRILGETSSIVVQAPGKGAKAGVAVTRVLLLGRGTSGPSAAAAASRPDKPSAQQREQASAAVRARSESMLRLARQVDKEPAGSPATGMVVDALARALASDEAPIVRVRAAMALGSLRDERAVDALDAATRDESASVRTQAITALGQVPGARSASVLGGILVNPSANRTERLVAAQALWSHKSPEARQYLQAGAADTDEQVRRASARAPLSPALPASATAGPAGANQGPAARR